MLHLSSIAVSFASPPSPRPPEPSPPPPPSPFSPLPTPPPTCPPGHPRPSPPPPTYPDSSPPPPPAPNSPEPSPPPPPFPFLLYPYPLPTNPPHLPVPSPPPPIPFSTLPTPPPHDPISHQPALPPVFDRGNINSTISLVEFTAPPSLTPSPSSPSSPPTRIEHHYLIDSNDSTSNTTNRSLNETTDVNKTTIKKPLSSIENSIKIGIPIIIGTIFIGCIAFLTKIKKRQRQRITPFQNSTPNRSRNNPRLTEMPRGSSRYLARHA